MKSTLAASVIALVQVAQPVFGNLLLAHIVGISAGGNGEGWGLYDSHISTNFCEAADGNHFELNGDTSSAWCDTDLRFEGDDGPVTRLENCQIADDTFTITSADYWYAGQFTGTCTSPALGQKDCLDFGVLVTYQPLMECFGGAANWE